MVQIKLTQKTEGARKAVCC